MSFSVDNTTAFVTGGNRGIGRQIVIALLERGASRVYAGARRPETLSDLVDEYGDRLVPVKLDITDAAQVRAAAAQASDAKLLVNNAGVVVADAGSWLGGDSWFEDARKEFDVNVLGTLAVTKAFAPALASNGGGAIANVSSIAAMANFPTFASYSASKAALHSVTQATRLFLSGQNTQVSEVYPGPVDTDLAREIDMEKASPKDVANAILDGLEEGQEDIMPDPMAVQMGGLFFQNPKELEGAVAAMAAEGAEA